MDNTSASQYRVAARAVGRTPEEHLALEQALARRRHRRLQLSLASPVSHPIQQHRHRPSHVKGTDGGNTRSQPLLNCDLQSNVGGHHEVPLPPIEMPEHLHEIDDSEIYSIFKMMQAENSSPSWEQTSLINFHYAIFRAKVAAAKSGSTVPALGIPPARKSKPAYSMRKVRGAGWHKRGYRDLGNMWINVRAGSYGHTRGMDAGENEALTSFVKSIFHSSVMARYPEGWYCDIFYKKKSVIRLLVDLENHGFDEDLVLVKDYFDGGETVYFKLYDETGEQRSLTDFS